MPSVSQLINGLSVKRDRRLFTQIFDAIRADMAAMQTAVSNSNRLTSSGGLAIKAGASAVVKTVVPYYYTIAGVQYVKAAGDMAALVGTVVADLFNVYVFYVDAAGTVTTAMGTAGATQALVVFPVTPATKVRIGFVAINPTGTGNFVGGTTALDDETVVPTAVYVDTVGSTAVSATLTTTA